MLDIHCHIVPNTDDGAKNIAVSMDIARAAQANGYTDILATSHYIIHDNEPDNIEFRNNIANLNEKYKQEGININVHVGNEIFFTNGIVNLIKEKKVCTLADSKYVLVELPLYSKIIPMNVYEEFSELQDMGYVPILAHPERYDFVTEDIKKLVFLIESGVLLQSNIGSINGKYGKTVAKNLKKMLKYDMVHFLATDSHTDSVHKMYGKCMKKIKKIVKDEEKLNKILIENPQHILSNSDIKIWYPTCK